MRWRTWRRWWAGAGLRSGKVAEEEGPLGNGAGGVRGYAQGRRARGMARPAWWVFAQLGAALGQGEPVATAADAFARLARSVDAFRGLGYERLGFGGRPAAVTVAGCASSSSAPSSRSSRSSRRSWWAWRS